MEKRYLSILVLLTISISTFALDMDKDSIITMSATQVKSLYKTASFGARVSVHDPSIVRDGNTYYIFGSHRACGRSTDLKNWYGQGWNYGIVSASGAVTSTTNCANVFTKNQTTKVKVLSGSDTVTVNFGPFDTDAWRYTANNPNLGGNQWAPDVIWNPTMKKWCMYMSLNGDDWRSSIALLTSNNITGPYIYQGPVVFSGFHWGDVDYKKNTDIELVLGTLNSLPSRYTDMGVWGNRWPNNIDPCTFYDEEGELWMAYGSWSGGIFILKLDKETGLRDYTYTYRIIGSGNNQTSDPYFGKKIAGGHYVSGEGAYIEHIGNYYYLFITNGGLEASKGYEMHYFRSKTPDGTYLDASSNNAIYSNYEMNYGPTAPHTKGMKILGTHQWANMNVAELSQGHNSMLLDEDGRAYLIYHTRFNTGNEGFEDRVHQMWVNSQGWLVAAPFEFAGKSEKYSKFTQFDVDSTELCTTNDIVGTYQFLLHPYKVNFASNAYSKPLTATLTAAGRVTGDYLGTWKVTEGTSQIRLHLRTRSNTTYIDYYGVVLPQTVAGTNMPSICFTAIASNGVSLWGCNVDGNYAVSNAYLSYTCPIKSLQRVNADLDLSAQTFKYGATLTWKSEMPDIISDKGKLTIPGCDSIVSVPLVYTIQKDNYSYSHTVKVRVQGDGTPVNSIETDPLAIRSIYRLNGTKVNANTIENLTPGIYIIDGKKRLVK